MEREELRTTLVNHLETLRRNLQVVSMEVLKTKYKKPFDALRQDICKAATAYTHFLVFDGMRIKHKYFDEAVPYIDTAVKQTKRLKQISDAAFHRQDIDEIESLALALRKEIEAALQPFYMRHMCLYVTPECFDDPPKTPEVYNDATACVWRDGTWQLLEDTSEGLGTVWVCYFQPDVIRKEFDLPDNLEPINILVIGYGNEEVADTERHEHLRIPLTDLVSYEKL